ncbi:unnamed protein product [Caenorhabditis angaria]|uniref:Uncharacterized protein n=1 Tax=Caenorhabditis angaria TaxID=860376 RepID=A0A9P1IX16_9PELO|nr:unnamed protein product [Caenorhabditis angaria]
MLIRLLFLVVVAITTISTSSEGDAPYSHRRLYGIRRLRMLRPIPVTAQHSPTHKIVDRRRQPAKLSENSESEEQESFVPRAQVPPSYHQPSQSSDPSSSEELPATYIVQTANKFGNSLDDARRKRIEARWKRLGINFKTVNYPHHNQESSENVHKYQIRQLNAPKKSEKIVEIERPVTQQPILHVINPIDQGFQPSSEIIQPLPTPAELPNNGDYHSRTKPVHRGLKFVQEKLSVRPRLRIRRPGEKVEEPMPEDPNLTPFMNNARAKFGYGTTVAPIATTTVYVPPTTPSRRPTTTTTTTETPIDFGDSGDVGGESGAGFGFGPAELPPEFQNVGFGVGGGDNGFNFNVPTEKEEKEEPKPTTTTTTTKAPIRRVVQRKQPNADFDKDAPAVIPQNSGLRAVEPPKEFGGSGGFGSFGNGAIGGGFGGGGSGAGFGAPPGPDPDFMPAGPPAAAAVEGPTETDFFTGDSALTPSKGPTGDGYGPAVFPGGAAPPPVPSVGLGGAAAGKSPYLGAEELGVTENPATTVKPSALLSVLNKADMGFNQAIEHFEHGTPVETAAIDILEVALGSQKLDSQAKLLGHVDRTFGLDNLQRLQRWANTAGAMEVFKDQFLKFAKNFQPAADLLPTVPPQLEYLFKTSGKK